jgi:hypothetical protein
MYAAMRSSVALGNEVSAPFEQLIGLRQGCVLSPSLFALFIADLPDYLAREGCHGVKLDGEEVNSLWYADDGVLLADGRDALQRSLEALACYCDRWRLCVNVKKTKTMAFRFSADQAHQPRPVFTYKGAAIEAVSEFCYLGVPVSEDGEWRQAVVHRLAMARRALGMWSRRCTALMLRPDTAAHIFKVCVLPVLEYGIAMWGMQPWAGRALPWQSVDGFVEEAARRILGVPLHTTKEAIYGDLGWRPMWVRATMLAAGYWARVTGLPSDSLPRRALAVQKRWTAARRPCWLLRLQCQCAAVPAVKTLWDEWLQRGDDPSFRPVTASEVRGRPVEEPWSDIVKEAIAKAADAQWHHRVNWPWSLTGTGGNKLRTYARFKSSVNQETYLSVNMPRKVRSFLSRFRMGVAPLQVEMGRRQDQQDAAARACPVCGAAVEDEEHFLMACPLYEDLRRDLVDETERVLQAAAHRRQLRAWRKGAVTARFDTIMALDDKEHIGRLARYLDQAWQSRAVCLAAHLAGTDLAGVDLDGSDGSVSDVADSYS